MPVKLNRVPRGILGLLQLKQSGATPNQILDELRAGLDSTYLYLLDNLTAIPPNAFGAVGAPGATIINTVPPTQIWWLVSAQAAITAQAIGDTARLSIGWSFGGQFQRFASQPAPVVALTATSRLGFGTSFGEPKLMFPGQGIGLAVDELSIAGATLNASIDVTAFVIPA